MWRSTPSPAISSARPWTSLSGQAAKSTAALPPRAVIGPCADVNLIYWISGRGSGGVRMNPGTRRWVVGLVLAVLLVAGCSSTNQKTSKAAATDGGSAATAPAPGAGDQPAAAPAGHNPATPSAGP